MCGVEQSSVCSVPVPVARFKSKPLKLLGVRPLLQLWREGVRGCRAGEGPARARARAGDPTASLCLCLFSLSTPILFPSCTLSLSQLSTSAPAAGRCQGHAHVGRCTRAGRVCWVGERHVRCWFLGGSLLDPRGGDTFASGRCSGCALAGGPPHVRAPTCCRRWITRAGIFFTWQFRTLTSRASCS